MSSGSLHSGSAILYPTSVGPAWPVPGLVSSDLPRPAWLIENGTGASETRAAVIGQMAPVYFQAVGFLAPYPVTSE
jgi:hypothetical protein